MADQNKYHLMLYHGTSEDYSNKIMQEGFKITQRREDHWIGNGIYFFREDESQALSWALAKYRDDNKVKSCHVIKVNLVVDGHNFLNLDSREGLYCYKQRGEALLTMLKKNNVELEFENPNQARCFIIDSLPKQYTVIQRTFKGQGNSNSVESGVVKESGLFLNGVQVCIRDEKEITSEINVCKKHKMNLSKGKNVKRIKTTR